MFKRELAVAIEAVSLASRLTRKVAASLSSADSLIKTDRSPVTVADFGSQAVVSSMLKKHFPDDMVVAEESAADLKENASLMQKVKTAVADCIGENLDCEEVISLISRNAGDGRSARFWTLDPVDGTKGFLRQEQYAICLALIENGAVCVAAMACPNLSSFGTGTLFAACRGGGSFMGNVEQPFIEHMLPIRSSASSDITAATLCESVESTHSNHGISSQFIKEFGIQSSLRLDSQAKYGMIAVGLADIYLRLPVSPTYQEKIWDHGCGSLLVTEAGGKVTDIHGNALKFGAGKCLTDNIGIIATNSHLHNCVQLSLLSLHNK